MTDERDDHRRQSITAGLKSAMAGITLVAFEASDGWFASVWAPRTSWRWRWTCSTAPELKSGRRSDRRGRLIVQADKMNEALADQTEARGGNARSMAFPKVAVQPSQRPDAAMNWRCNELEVDFLHIHRRMIEEDFTNLHVGWTGNGLQSVPFPRPVDLGPMP